MSLVTQPMLQRRPNPTELRSMDSFIQILCRFQKCKQKVPPPSLPCTKKSPFTPTKESIDLNSVGFSQGCIIGWVTSISKALQCKYFTYSVLDWVNSAKVRCVWGGCTLTYSSVLGQVQVWMRQDPAARRWNWSKTEHWRKCYDDQGHIIHHVKWTQDWA